MERVIASKIGPPSVVSEVSRDCRRMFPQLYAEWAALRAENESLTLKLGEAYQHKENARMIANDALDKMANLQNYADALRKAAQNLLDAQFREPGSETMGKTQALNELFDLAAVKR